MENYQQLVQPSNYVPPSMIPTHFGQTQQQQAVRQGSGGTAVFAPPPQQAAGAGGVMMTSAQNAVTPQSFSLQPQHQQQQQQQVMHVNNPIHYHSANATIPQTQHQVYHPLQQQQQQHQIVVLPSHGDGHSPSVATALPQPAATTISSPHLLVAPTQPPPYTSPPSTGGRLLIPSAVNTPSSSVGFFSTNGNPNTSPPYSQPPPPPQQLLLFHPPGGVPASITSQTIPQQIASMSENNSSRSDSFKKEERVSSSPAPAGLLAQTPPRIQEEQTNENSSNSNNSSCFIAGLPFNYDELMLRELFSHCGEIAGVRILLSTRSEKAGQSRGCGFVHFSHPSEAKQAIEQLHGSTLKDQNGAPKRILVTVADKTAEFRSEDSERLFVRHIPVSVSKTELAAAFTKFGTVVGSEMMPDTSIRGREEGTGSLMGYVTMSSVEEGKSAVKSADDTNFFGEDRHAVGGRLIVKPAETMERRNARRQVQTLPKPSGYKFGGMGAVNPKAVLNHEQKMREDFQLQQQARAQEQGDQ